jgi:hypothetical protein
MSSKSVDGRHLPIAGTQYRGHLPSWYLGLHPDHAVDSSYKYTTRSVKIRIKKLGVKT